MSDSRDDKPEGGKSPSSPPASSTTTSSSSPPSPAPSAETFGQYLGRERELRGFSLQQVSDTTRIPAGNLKALEADDLSRLPARVFVLGYIRAYAHAIGLSPDEAVLRYEEQAQKAGPEPEENAARRSRKGRVVAAILAAAVAAGGAAAWYFTR
ncbi:MAG: helix-turn-helix transcriptional regulator [Myxococcales bacterium]